MKKFEDIMRESIKHIKSVSPHQKPKTLTKFLQDKHKERSSSSSGAVRKANYEKTIDLLKIEKERKRDLKPITR